MRRSKRFCAIEAARQLAGNSSDSDSSLGTSCESEDEEEVHQPPNPTEIDWKFVKPNKDHNVELEDFPTLQAGIQTEDIPTNVNENVDFFLNLFLTEELLEKLVIWTNKRAEKEMETEDIHPEAQLSGILARWHPVTKNEVRKFFGILLCMRLNQKPEIRQYWSRSILYKSEFFQDSKCLARNRFEEICKFLRFCDYDELNDEDKLTKIRPFLEMVQRICKCVYIPKKHFC